eukprot:gene9740-10735_t
MATAEELYEDYDDDGMEPNEDEEDDAIEDAAGTKTNKKSRQPGTTGLHIYNPPPSSRRRWNW